jgi:hypothetical protein
MALYEFDAGLLLQCFLNFKKVSNIFNFRIRFKHEQLRWWKPGSSNKIINTNLYKLKLNLITLKKTNFIELF